MPLVGCQVPLVRMAEITERTTVKVPYNNAEEATTTRAKLR